MRSPVDELADRRSVLSRALIREGMETFVDRETRGERIRLQGRVTDGAGDAVPDADGRDLASGRRRTPSDGRRSPRGIQRFAVSGDAAPTSTEAIRSRPSSQAR